MVITAGKGSVSCSFLLKLLRVASLSGSGEAGKRELIKRIGRQLEDASVPDLLIPTVEGENTIYDIDVVLNIVEEFVMQDNRSAKTCAEVTEELEGMKSLSIVSGASMVAVTKLVDGYLAEVAKDPNLPLSKFVDLAEMVSNESRAVHDGLYRAIDMFLKEHPSMNKSDRKKLCGLIDCKLLSPDACGHAVQNERLPLEWPCKSSTTSKPGLVPLLPPPPPIAGRTAAASPPTGARGRPGRQTPPKTSGMGRRPKVRRQVHEARREPRRREREEQQQQRGQQEALKWEGLEREAESYSDTEEDSRKDLVEQRAGRRE
uniref:NPH3 domain-containing protein n=1 Tax=Ananas comosus var. bracteatus TaxID=296719 RepID=A0A6V7Q487_ANACO|nr:unnamed protein product [Ananas comosus var. bracteatus]